MEQLAPVFISALIEIVLNVMFKTAEKLPDLGASCAVDEWPGYWYFGQHHVLCSHMPGRIIRGNLLPCGQRFDNICNAGVSYPLNGVVVEAFRDHFVLDQNSSYHLTSLKSCLRG